MVSHLPKIAYVHFLQLSRLSLHPFRKSAFSIGAFRPFIDEIIPKSK